MYHLFLDLSSDRMLPLALLEQRHHKLRVNGEHLVHGYNQKLLKIRIILARSGSYIIY